LLELNQTTEAEAQQAEALRIAQRNWPPESEQALAAVYKYAEWLAERGYFQLARDQFSRALRVIRDHYGKDNVRQVPALIGVGNSFREQRLPDGQGFGALQDALALLLAEPERDPLAIAGVLRDLGDWQIAFDKTGYDGEEYRRAWQLLGTVTDGDRLRREWFTGPIYTLREPVSLRGISNEPDAPMGHVIVRFDLDRSGRSLNVAVAESAPPGLKDEAVLRHIRRSRFRPQVVDGELTTAEGLALRLNFRYTPDALSSVDNGNDKGSRHD
jgi:TonB family protein